MKITDDMKRDLAELRALGVNHISFDLGGQVTMVSFYAPETPRDPVLTSAIQQTTPEQTGASAATEPQKAPDLLDLVIDGTDPGTAADGAVGVRSSSSPSTQ